MKKAKFSAIPMAQNILQLCLTKNIKKVIISPGSRNAPLTISFANHPKIEAYSVIDERSAAFMAMGMAQELDEPVAICCTSGSALLNYFPAVAEAFYSDIPLVVIAADRPVERINIGDGQTIQQKNVYGDHVLHSANLYSELVFDELPEDAKIRQKYREAQQHNEREINLALNTAIEKKGPVHINVPFYEPLYDTATEYSTQPVSIDPILQPKTIAAETLEPYAKIWNRAERKLILVGVNKPDAIEQEFLDKLAEDPSVLVFSETTSNLHHPDFVSRIDQLIAPLEIAENPEKAFKELQPDVLLTMGGMVISKKIKAFLRNYQPKHHWHIDSKKALNTYFCLNKHFDVTANEFFSQFIPQLNPLKSDYRDKWLAVKTKNDQSHERYKEEIPYSDFHVFGQVLKTIPEEQLLHISNSAAIRYAQLFPINPKNEVFCNRGTSGIDGSSSTAVGAARAAQKDTTLITGDLAFFYDSNAFWNQIVPETFHVIIMNNGGGGIFRILPGAKHEDYFKKYFETRHGRQAQQIAEEFNFDYSTAHDKESLEKALKGFYEKKRAILEVFTPTEVNDEILLNYFKYLQERG